MSRPHTIRTFTGKIVRPFDLQPSDIDILDIAHHLSKQCRFAGAIAGDDTIYSVAEHAVRVSLAVEKESKRVGESPEVTRMLARWGLHHDDEGAYLPDLPSPIKHHPEMSFYRQAGRLAQKVICHVFDLWIEEPALVKMVDKRMCATEQRDIRGPRPADFGEAGDNEGVVEPFEDRIVPWTPAQAKNRFLARWAQLSRKP